MNSDCLLQIEPKTKTWEKRKLDAVADFEGFRERRTSFSLDFWEIRPSEFVGTRRKVVLRDEAYAWALVLGVFNKLREVGVLSYLF